jgi:signal transduction histidine kinase
VSDGIEPLSSPPTGGAKRSYPGLVKSDEAVRFELRPWGADESLVALLGDQGAAEFRALFDAFPDPVGVLWALRGEDGAIVDFAFGYGNLAMLSGFRLTAATPDRYTLLEALPAMRGSHAFDEHVRVCQTGVPWVHEVTYDTPFADGYMLGTFVQRVAKLGDGLMVVLVDVTDQRRMEAELQGYANLVAHDLSEPLAHIQLLVTLLEQRPDTPPSPELLQQLRGSAVRARELIDGVLAYARSGELRRERVSLARVMADVAADLRPSLETHATLVVGELPDVDADPRQLRRVFQNLVSNALRFRRGDSVLVEVSAMRDAREWVVSVRDDGVGVPPEHTRQIFGMFARFDTRAEGLGLGLAVCRRIVEAHGGRIWVEPADGGGALFRFTLPR